MEKNTFMRNMVSLAVGVVFAIGLAVSGMTQPQKIIDFLSPQNWDASLLFVMAGAVLVHSFSYLFIKKRKSPLLDTQWHVPTRNDISTRLVIGSALFGIGWGLGGYCPGPAVTSLASGSSQAALFVVSMLVGMLLFKKTEPYLKLRS